MLALNPLMEGKTIILVTHQLHNVENMDRIIVLKDGGIVEEGTHASLLTRNGLYQELHTIPAGR